MKWVVPGNRLILKAVCVGLVLTLGAGLVAAGAMAASGCGMKCCCASKQENRQHVSQVQIRSAMGCCSGNSQMPCDLVAATQVQLPEISLAASTSHLPTGVGSANDIDHAWIDRHGFRSHVFDPGSQENFLAPPLYLQNLSFLS